MSPQTNSDYVLFYDKSETARIEWQHDYLTSCAGGHLFPSYIDEDKILNVADIATGTGAWLRDVSNHLAPKTTEDLPRAPRTYYGFDINSKPFPTELKNKEGFHHVIHNISNPFPSELRGKFQLVHVRLVFTFLAEKDIPTVFQHFSSLLSPGGYLVWTELEALSLGVSVPSPRHEEILNTLGLFVEKLGRCSNIPLKLRELSEAETGMGFVSHTAFRPLLLKKPEESKHYEFEVFNSFLKNAYMQIDTKLGEEKAAERADRELEELRGFLEKGEVWDKSFGTVTFRKI